MRYPKVLLLLCALSLCPNAPARALTGVDAWDAFIAGDPDKAYATARPLAEGGDMAAQGLLGYLYWNGVQVPKDPAQAEVWFKKYAEQAGKLAEKGDPAGEHGLGWLYENGWGGLKQDYAEAVKWYTKAAEKGNSWSQNDLGSIYYNGWGVQRDYAEAAKWWKAATDRGHKTAPAGLGWLYHNGLGVKQDYAEAARLYRISADARYVNGQHALACLYYFGLGVKQDYAEAGKLWLKADAQGFAYSPWGLGLLFQNGQGGFPKDYAQALKQYKAGVERGDLAYAGTALGGVYENGQGVVQDFVEAYKWYLLGAARDNPTAREGMSRLRQSMTKEQVAEAQKLAAAFDAPKPMAEPAAPAPVKVLASDVDAPPFRLKEDPTRFALVVGIDKYKDLPSAEFAERDAESVRRTLVAMGWPERNVVTLKGPEATIAGLKKYLEEWLPRNAAGASSVFLYFSGHGAPEPRNGSAYLVPWDGDPSYLKSTAYPLKKVYSVLAGLKAGRTIAAMDACFSGAGGRSVLAKGARPLVVQTDASALPPDLTVLAAASGEQITGTLDDQGHGAFTYYLLKGLGGEAKDAAGAVTAKALYDYLKPKVQDAARRQNRDQEPVLRGPGDRELARF